MNKINRARKIDRCITILFTTVAAMIILLLMAFVGYVVFKGIRSFDLEFLTFTRKGIMNQVLNTIYMVFLSLVFSAPIGILTGIYIVEFAKEGRMKKFIKLSIETLSSLPSIIVGLFGYLVFILMTGAKWNMLAGALTLSILSVPLIATTTIDALNGVKQEVRLGAYALGATSKITILQVLLPACISRIFTGVLLAAGRSFGEAAALLYTAGMSTDIVWSNLDITSRTNFLNPFRPAETLSLHIWAQFTESTAVNAKDIANFSSAVLIIIVLLFNIFVRKYSKSLDRKLGGKVE